MGIGLLPVVVSLGVRPRTHLLQLYKTTQALARTAVVMSQERRVQMGRKADQLKLGP